MKVKLPARLLTMLRFVFSPYGVYYLGGARTLPPPLTGEEEASAIRDLKEKKEGAGTVLIERNLRLVVFIAKKFENTGIEIDDLISIGSIGLIKAIDTFCPEKGIKLATYASRCIENEILMYIRKNGRLKAEVSLDEPLSSDFEGNELKLGDVLGTEEDSVSRAIEEDEEKKAVSEALSSLSMRDRKIISLRYGLSGEEPLTQKETADLLGISQSYISRIEKKVILRLKAEMEGKR